MKKETKKQIAEREFLYFQLSCIAKLMGGHQNPEQRWYGIIGRQRTGDPDSYGYYLTPGLKYNTLWDGWLKDAVNKIMSLDWVDFNHDEHKMNHVRQTKASFKELSILTPHDDLFKRVAEFASWYNQNKYIPAPIEY